MLAEDPVLRQWDVFDAVLSHLRSARHIAVDGVGGASQAYLVASAVRALAGSALVIVPDNERVDQLHDDLAAFLAEHAGEAEEAGLAVFPSLESLLYEEARVDRELIRERLSTLRRLLAGEPTIVIATPEALLHMTVPPAALRQAAVTLTTGATIEQVELTGRLVQLGYERQAMVEAPGEFGVRGGIVDVFPSTSLAPVRVEFFGDEVESIRLFDPSTQRSRGSLSSLHLLPAREVLIGEDSASAVGPMRAALEQRLRSLRDLGKEEAAERLVAKVEYELAQLEQGGYFDNAEYYLPYFHPPTTLLDYLPADTPVFIDSPLDTAEHFRHFEAELAPLYRARLQSGSLLPIPHELYAGLPTLARWLAERPVASLSLVPQADRELTPPPAAQLTVEVRGVESFAGRLDQLVAALRGWQQERYAVVVASYQNDRLAEILAESGIGGVAAAGGLTPELGRIVLSHRKLSGSFRLPDARLVVLADQEVFGASRLRRSLRRRHTQGIAITSVSQLSPGDFVVHINHGIGVYDGLERRTVDGADREFMRINYAGEDRLFVPVDQLDRVQKYIGGEEAAPTVHRLGGADWDRTKRRARKQAQEVAKELVRIYATRQSQPGHAFSPDTPWQQEMEAGFPYDETPDQLTAIEATKADMELERPMDRLICGDVGFGKTEVAIRAAFKAVMDGKQVAVLVPTTILAEQHLNTFKERTAAYPIKVEMLSRFRHPAERRKVVEGLRAGTVDIVIGTHRLLSKDIEFKALGLLIIDEEQRFGVRHKERLKQLRATVDVLTMTATPIPRTLHMSLSGIRDMSVINDPPEGRMPIRTRAIPRDDDLVREALMRELERGGQVYFVHNRVESIGYLAEYVRKLVPHARIAIGHGQLPEDRLEEIMLDFYAGRYDILVCTTIIESGLDIPNVNTIVVDQSDKMGLAQLYQLRGRVGRSDRQAYAYLTWTPHKKLTETAQKRIAAIREFSELGSGFKIAMRDLEIRGAGNLLGAEQSGFIAAVGFEMYTQMLAEAVSELQGQEVMPETQVNLDVPVNAFIPEDYVPGLNQRIEIYKRLAAVRTAAELREMEQELHDRFGTPLPPAVSNLLRLVSLKLDCMAANVLSISTERTSVVLRLTPDRRLPPLLARKLQRQLSSVPTTEFRLAAPVVSQDRVALAYNNLTSEQLLDLIEQLVTHLGKITNSSALMALPAAGRG